MGPHPIAALHGPWLAAVDALNSAGTLSGAVLSLVLSLAVIAAAADAFDSKNG